MKFPKELTTVTPLSKILAAILFISLPFIGFFLGMQYQEMMDLYGSQQEENNTSIARVPTPTPFAVPTVDPSVIANWKLFTNEKYGYTFKYPSPMEVRTGGMGLLDLVQESRIIVDYPGIKSSGDVGRLSIEVTNKDGTCPRGTTNINQGLEAFAKKKSQLNKSAGYLIEELTETIVANQKAYQFTLMDAWSDECEEASLTGKHTVVITEKNGGMYLFIFPSNINIFDQILSTFRFSN